MKTAIALLVGNQSLCTGVLGSMLRAEGYFTVTARATDAIQWALDLLPDLILIEPEAADEAYLSIIHRLRTHPDTARVPIIVLSSDLTDREESRLLASGADSVMVKPVALSALGNVITDTRAGKRPGSCRSIRVEGWA